MIKYNKEIDEENIKIFESMGTKHSLRKRHRCVICEKFVGLVGSYSLEGHKLVCDKCHYEKFDANFKKLREWQEELEDE